MQSACIHDIFAMRSKFAEDEAYFTGSFYEIYGNKLFDLLNKKNKLIIQEDYNNKFQITGLKQVQVGSPEEMLEVMEQGNASRVTETTHANDESSRSHAICQINVYSKS